MIVQIRHSLLHNDHLGTLRLTTGTTGTASGSDVFTAFGERISGTADRFGYVGAFGYQSHTIAESTNPDAAFPYMHVGHRYYDPSSGRFLQRDPIGLGGRLNVYGYVLGKPTNWIDPSGLQLDPGLYPEWFKPTPTPKPPRPPPETPAEEIARINRRLNYTAAGFAGAAALTWWFPPAAITFAACSAAAWGAATSVY